MEMTVDIEKGLECFMDANFAGEIKELKSICNLIVCRFGHKGIIEFADVESFLSFQQEIESELKAA